MYLLLSVLGLRCLLGFSLVAESQGLLFSCNLQASHCSALLQSMGSRAHELCYLWHTCSIVAAPRLQSTGSIVVVHQLSCSTSCGIFLDQGSNPCVLPWQTDSLPLSHQRRPGFSFLKYKVEIIIESFFTRNSEVEMIALSEALKTQPVIE